MQRDRPKDNEATPWEEVERQLLEVAEITMQGGTLELAERDLKVTGNVYRGGVVRGAGGVSVQGHVAGNLTQRCVIEVGGDVVVKGDVQGARIRCRSLKVGGNLEQAEVLSDRAVEVGGRLVDTEVQVGIWGQEFAQIRALMREMAHLEAELNAMDGRMRMASRRFLRDYGTIDVQFGNVITKSRRGIEVDLKDIYRILRDRSEEEVDRGLQEFFFKVIVGALTRTNRTYVSQNPSRQNIFLKLVSELREHIVEVRTRDKLQANLKAVKDQQKELIDLLKAPTRWGVKVQGQVGPATTIRLLQFRHSAQEAEAGGEPERRAPAVSPPARAHEGEGGVDLERRAAYLQIVAQEGSELVLNLSSADGSGNEKKNVPQAEFSSIHILLKEGLPAWQGVQTG
ncbi:MAG: hypothetical protein EXS64_11710 [Candidatus Latescibacteria bacterium]|nr:hypothetical protein [Candidatus Latescibacterota bacterium]